MSPRTAPIYQLKVTLDDTHPPIWRRVLVSSNVTLEKLHDILQTVMGWEDYHLHMFTLGEQIFGDPREDEFGDLGTLNEANYRLGKVIARVGQKLDYEYDFGDSWAHTLLLEKILPPEAETRLPLCLKGKRACPPEDVGGVWGYENFLEALSDPQHEEHDEYLDWVGGEFDPEAFDLETVNQRLRQQKSRPSAESTWPEEDVSELARKLEIISGAWLVDEKQRQAITNLPLRRDVLTFLTYLQSNKVNGTQSTGNLPLKAVQAICAEFVKPPTLESKIGDTVYRVRSETDVWPLFFVHALAAVGGLAAGGMARRWQVTPLGEKFIAAAAETQLWMVFQTWWTQVNWEIAAPYLPEDFPLSPIHENALEHLLQLPLERSSPFELFADQLIRDAGLNWPHGDGSHERTILHGLIEFTIARPLSDFGILKLEFGPHPTLGAKYRQLSALTLTALGKQLLESVKEQ